jgi:hypothetical protein
MSPTQRSLAKLRSEGYRVAVVDILAIRGSETLAVQSTSGSNVSTRVKKTAEAEATAEILAAGWKFFVHGWRKLAAWGCECGVLSISGTMPHEQRAHPEQGELPTRQPI